MGNGAWRGEERKGWREVMEGMERGKGGKEMRKGGKVKEVKKEGG